MAVLAITKGKGGVGRPATMTVIPPSREVSIEALRRIAQEAGLDGLVVADLLSALAMHERSAARFEIAAARQAGSEELSRLHAGLAHAHLAHLATLESVMKALGIDPLYASPMSRMAHHLGAGLIAAPLLSGSVDATTMDAALLDVALIMIEKCQDTARVLGALAAAAKPSAATDALREGVRRLQGDTDKTVEHVRSTLAAFAVAHATAAVTG